MASEELPGVLHNLKITRGLTIKKLVDRNPFYSPIKTNTNPSANINFEQLQMHSVKQKMPYRWKSRIRRRSESFLDDCKQANSAGTGDNIEIFNPLRSHGVYKHSLKRHQVVANAKRILLREPILRSLHSSCGSGRLNSLSLKDESNGNKNFLSSNADVDTISNGMCSFRDLINQCDILLELEKSKSNWHSLTSSSVQQKKGQELHRETILQSSAALKSSFKTLSLLGTTCSQQASSLNASNKNQNNSDDITIVELASYFDTMVHIPKKMSSMAEMMYI